ncbi:Lysosome-associated membrane glycoprotein 2 [Acipenser ruthenus]|uniref:Lysosome-associated membrane glycoprotein 2 n=1 Tax=Acipenser ruthenus TaxID=7906 RepID=A0A444TZL7_ACIRT|nr:Lysosome-associated membrane glycoprotein 2 [Acipenser ruthenus]
MLTIELKRRAIKNRQSVLSLLDKSNETFIYFISLCLSWGDSRSHHNMGVIKVVANDTMPPVPMDHYYRCMSDDVFKQGNVTQTFWNVSIQAYIKDGNLSENATVCSADTPTTVSPVTNITTIAPVTNVTTAAPTTTPKPTPTPKPDKETYKVSRGNDTCLIITMGLQLNYSTSAQAPWEVKNIDPNVTTASGTCGNDTSTITLNENNTIYLTFSFAKVTQQLGINNNLSYWEATLGSSYMCNKDQVFKVTDKLSINTYDLRVQPFNVTNGEYSTAHECSLDDSSLLIPIIVGAALAGLIVIVVIAYLIGRRKTYVGYQTL